MNTDMQARLHAIMQHSIIRYKLHQITVTLPTFCNKHD